MPASTCRGERARPRKADYGQTRGASRGIPARRPEVARVLAALIVFKLIVDRGVLSNTPGRSGTRVITDGILPACTSSTRAVAFRRYSKDGRALCTETTFKRHL